MFHVCGVDVGWFSGIIESLFLGAKGGGADLRLEGGGGGGQEDGITMIFSHHIYYAQSKVKWGGGQCFSFLLQFSTLLKNDTVMKCSAVPLAINSETGLVRTKQTGLKKQQQKTAI